MTNTRFTTNNVGNPVAGDNESLTAGTQGPILLHDHYLGRGLTLGQARPCAVHFFLAHVRAHYHH